MRTPSWVLSAAYLLGGASAVWLTTGIASLWAIPQYVRFYGDLQESRDAGGVAGLLLILVAIVALLGAGLALLLAVLGARGNSRARAWTYVVCATSIAVSASVVGLDVFAALPWHGLLTTCASILTVLLVTGATILLALPSSQAYFRIAAEERAVRAARARIARQPAMPYPPPMPYPPGIPPHLAPPAPMPSSPWAYGPAQPHASPAPPAGPYPPPAGQPLPPGPPPAGR